MVKTKPTKATYLGCKVEMFEIRENGPDGPRWIYTRHIDKADERNGGWPAGSCTKRRVTGNGLRGTFRELEPAREITKREYDEAKDN